MKFNLEKRARALSDNPHAPRALLQQWRARQLAREALEAAAKECEKKAGKTIAGVYACGLHDAAAINRRIAKPGARSEPSQSEGDSQAQPIGTQSRPCAGEGMSSAAPPAPLSDAEILERSAEILRKKGCFVTEAVILEEAAKLRAAEEVGIFAAFGGYSAVSGGTIGQDAREWFAPLVARLEQTRDRLGDYSFPPEKLRDDIAETLSALRARARAQGGGRAEE